MSMRQAMSKMALARDARTASELRREAERALANASAAGNGAIPRSVSKQYADAVTAEAEAFEKLSKFQRAVETGRAS